MTQCVSQVEAPSSYGRDATGLALGNCKSCPCHEKTVGRIFRAHIWGGIALRINDEEIAAIDPLFLRGDRHIDRATR